MRRGPQSEDDRELAELAALADGTLAEERRAALAQRVEASPELAERLAEQERALELIHGAVGEVQAPASLREALAAPARPRARRRRFRLAAAFATAAVVLGVVALALLSSSTPVSPTVVQAAELGAKPATGGAPPAQPGTPELLAAEQDGVAFPNWRSKFGWVTTGQRHDRLHGRDTTTVFYEKHGLRLAYTIVSGERLTWPEGARVVVQRRVAVRVLQRGGRVIATWLRRGRTCVLSGVGPRESLLVKLASWRGAGAIGF